MSDCLPNDRPGREDIVDLFTTQAAALLELQDMSGLWYHILEDPETALEMSATLQFTCGFAHGVDLGLLDEEYLRAAESEMDVVEGVVNDDGEMRRVAVPPGGPEAPLGVTSYGQGWFLLAATELWDR